MFITTTLHETPQEGFFVKEDYKKKLKRFRKKWTKKELFVTLKDLGFEIIYEAYDEEIDNGKKWIVLLVTKSN